MKKSDAIQLLGGSQALAAQELGVTRQAVHDWPEVLSEQVADKVTKTLLKMREKVLKAHAGMADIPKEERDALADKIGISSDTLYQIMTSRKVPSALLARKIADADKRFKLEELRPKDYWIYWPELKGGKLAKENKA